MILREKIRQMLVVYPTAIIGLSKVMAVGETARRALET